MNLEIINLLRKTITSLSCIEKTTTDKNLKNEACESLIDLINCVIFFMPSPLD